MMLSAALILPLFAQDAVVTYEAPSFYVDGEPFQVTVSATTESAAAVPSWYFTPGVFSVGGNALGDQPEDSFVTLLPGQTISTTFDLSTAIIEAEASKGTEFHLAFAGGGEARTVPSLQAAPMGIDFMTLPEEQLGDYQVIMTTIAGTMWMEFWPDVAPNHVRNFLDLSYTGFYDGSNFHRVIPGFMIQGGGARDRQAPRTLKNEFNDRRHTPGVLSMARMGVDRPGPDGKIIPAFDSATSEFFVMHAVYPSLDGKYTAFGKLIEGLDVVEQIVHTGNTRFPRGSPQASAPTSRQSILQAIVVKAPKR